MARVREKLYVTVPSLFRCPISMDVMRSPVSLCTGVTYDRSSIQHWLDTGHDTCPATMQVLPSKDFIPNLTLHRLIRLWLLSGEPSSPEPVLSRISTEKLRLLIRGIQTDGEELAVLLSKIAEFAAFSGENRRSLASFPGFDSAIVRLLSSGCSRIDVLEKVMAILDLILRENGNGNGNGNGIVVRDRIRGLIFESRRDCFASVISILRNGSRTSKVESARVLESLAVDFQSKRSIAETQGLLSVLSNLLGTENEGSAELHDAVLSLLIALSVTHSTKAELVRSGLVEVLSKTLQKPATDSSTAERCLRLLAVLATCAEGRAAMSGEPSFAAAVVERLAKASKKATEDAVAVLWSLCCLGRKEKVQDEVAKRNGMTVILLAMQRDCEEHVRRMCRDLIKALNVACKNNGSSPLALVGGYDTKTTHIKPC